MLKLMKTIRIIAIFLIFFQSFSAVAQSNDEEVKKIVAELVEAKIERGKKIEKFIFKNESLKDVDWTVPSEEAVDLMGRLDKIASTLKLANIIEIPLFSSLPPGFTTIIGFGVLTAGQAVNVIDSITEIAHMNTMHSYILDRRHVSSGEEAIEEAMKTIKYIYFQEFENGYQYPPPKSDSGFYISVKAYSAGFKNMAKAISQSSNPSIKDFENLMRIYENDYQSYKLATDQEYREEIFSKLSDSSCNSDLNLDGIIGLWSGTYTANQGETSLLLHIKHNNDIILAEFHFGPTARNANVPSGSFYMDLIYDHESKAINLFGTEWIKKPESYYMLDMKGVLNYSENTIKGDMFQAVNDPMPRGNERQGSFVLSKTHDSLYTTGLEVSGYWFGTYRSGTQERSLLLFISDENQNMQGEFNFGPTTRNSTMPQGQFFMEVIYDRKTNGIDLYGIEWGKRPPSYYMIDLSGSVDIVNRNMIGGYCYSEIDPPSSGYTGEEIGQFHLNRASLLQEVTDDGTNDVPKKDDENDDVCYIKTLNQKQP